MPDPILDANQSVVDPSATANPAPEPVSEDEQTPVAPVDSDNDADFSADSIETDEMEPDYPNDGNVPFHKHPRFRQLTERNRQNEEKISQLEEALREREMLESASPQEKIAYELKKKYGLASSDDLEEARRSYDELKDQMAFDAFLAKNPAAAPKASVLRTLAYTEQFQNSSYDEIYRAAFGDTDTTRKVVSRRPKAGISPRSSHAPATTPGSVAGPHIYTRAEIDSMDIETFTKNRAEIQKQMSEGKIQ